MAAKDAGFLEWGIPESALGDLFGASSVSPRLGTCRGERFGKIAEQSDPRALPDFSPFRQERLLVVVAAVLQLRKIDLKRQETVLDLPDKPRGGGAAFKTNSEMSRSTLGSGDPSREWFPANYQCAMMQTIRLRDASGNLHEHKPDSLIQATAGRSRKSPYVRQRSVAALVAVK